MSDHYHIEGNPPQISREGFEHIILVKYGPKALEAVKQTIEPCPCKGTICQGWRLDVATLTKALG